MFGPYGCLPLDVWTIIFHYLDFSTLYTFTKVHPRFTRAAKLAYSAKRKRRPDFSSISAARVKIVSSDPVVAFDVRGSTIYLIQNLSGQSLWVKESKVSSWSLSGKHLSPLEEVNRTIHRANCTELVGISVTKSGILAVSSCRADTLAAIDVKTSALLWTTHVPSPWCVSCDATRDRLIVSSLWHAIFLINQQGQTISSLNMDELNPSSIALVPSTSEFLISDRYMRTLQLVNSTGKVVRKISATDPFGVDVDEDDHLWICSSAKRSIEILSLCGKTLHSFECGSIEDPKQVRMADDGTVIVMDSTGLYIY